MSKGESIVFMGHGTSHPANACYFWLQRILDEEGLPVLIGTLEAHPNIYSIVSMLKQRNIHHIHLMPFLLSIGKHARVDMAGDGERSWKSVLECNRFSVSVHLQGLGENVIVQNMFVENLRDALAEENA
jgi:sirohydrochlorin cobaltochelatase